MARWEDIAQWRGPTGNEGGALAQHRILVLHIAQGSYEGTISWEKNLESQVSSHFVVGKDGRAAQLIDTDRVAWTEAAGNLYCLSIEFEGYSGQLLTQQQLTVAAKVLAKAHQVYGIPLVVTDSTGGNGLGFHGMGGAAWGGHPDCPGAPIVGQRQSIVDMAKTIVGGVDVGGEAADYAFDGVYNGADARINPQSWMAKVVHDLNAKVDVLVGQPAGVLTDAQVDRIAGVITAEMGEVITAAVERGVRTVLGSLDDAAGT